MISADDLFEFMFDLGKDSPGFIMGCFSWPRYADFWLEIAAYAFVVALAVACYLDGEKLKMITFNLQDKKKI